MNIEETAPASRRGQRIRAMRTGSPIPEPELAAADARPGNQADSDVLAMVEGKKRREEIEHLRATHGGTVAHEWANEGDACVQAIGPQVKFRFA